MVTTSGGVATLLTILPVLIILSPSVVGLASAGTKEDCQPMIANDLTSCLEYSTGKMDTPTKDCCRSVNGMKEKNPKCLCYAVEQANGDNFRKAGVQFRRILSLSSACHLTGSNISDCPKILKIPEGDPRNSLFNGSIQANSSLSDGSPSESSHSGPGFRHHIGQAGAVVGAVASTILASLI